MEDGGRGCPLSFGFHIRTTGGLEQEASLYFLRAPVMPGPEQTWMPAALSLPENASLSILRCFASEACKRDFIDHGKKYPKESAKKSEKKCLGLVLPG